MPFTSNLEIERGVDKIAFAAVDPNKKRLI